MPIASLPPHISTALSPFHECRIPTPACRDQPAPSTTSAPTKICTYDRVCAPISCTCATSRLHRKLTSAKMRTGGPSRVIESVCSRKRRQSCSKVDSDNAHDPPDDPASKLSVKTEPTTSGLGQTWGNPGRRGTRRDTSRKRRKPKPADPGAPAACTLCESKAWRSSHARGIHKPACSTK